MHRFLTSSGGLNKRLTNLWKSKLPMKLKVFMWLALRGRIQTGVALKRKNWKGDANCIICNTPETVDHVLFQCVMAKFVWTSFKEALGWERVPSNMADLLTHWIPLGCADYDVNFFLFVIVAWAMWTTRNKIMIQKCFPRSPIVTLYKVNSFMQKWWVLLRVPDRRKLQALHMNMEAWVKNLVERSPPSEDPWIECS